ncbi:porin family protein [Hymenobacter rubripertinctus]|uniref:PorT family protein n=1 Tax=Hymenobacter rubripertinctus TaxID=2029981 RepID=A0A418QYF7_9BACT|nr:porin family protein [Hymenobacter rubripertinctus]RIY10210.1 PorT family protein [Hymenobacter rubripertinctus]
MKNALLVLLFSGATLGAASAQVEIGLKISPSVTNLRAATPSGDDLKAENSKLSLGGGIIVDYFFGQNYAFSTGLELVGRGGNVSYFDQRNQKRYEQKISLQYLQVPLTVKLFTNDVATDTKVYFQLGGALGGTIAGRINGDKYYNDPLPPSARTKAIKHVIVPDVNLRLGTGIEYQLGQSTKMVAGVSYHRGLLNVDKYFADTRGIKDAELKNSEFALDLGIKF